jgi:nitroimidazol reductase NimA-like FMN-containing flavoprotein (pyridoxamine 5'-phosphate oxidase superfamily)
MEVDSKGLEVLGRDECLRLLTGATLGRIGFTSGALPTVLPVTFHLDDERIYVRTGRGSTLDAALQNSVVAFEADDFDPTHHCGWSVAVTGLASAVSTPVGLRLAHRQLPAPWANGESEAVLAISTELVSGRRTTAAPRAIQESCPS